MAFDRPTHESSKKKRTTLIDFSEAVTSAAKHFRFAHAIVEHSFETATTAIALGRVNDVKRIVLISCPSSLRHVVSGFAHIVEVPRRSHAKIYPLMQRLHSCYGFELLFHSIGPNIQLPIGESDVR